jgi:thiol:disulfide interchange protein DsbD
LRLFLAIKTMFLLLLLSALTAPMSMNALAANSSDEVNWCDYEEGCFLSKRLGKPILLEFYQNTCVFCQQQNGTYLDSNVIQKSKEFVCIRVDVDIDPEITSEYDVGISPMLYFMMPNGTIISEIYGYVAPDGLIENMTEAQKYFELNYVGTTFDPDLANNDDSSEETSEAGTSDSDLILPLALIAVTAVIALILIARFIFIYKKYNGK